MKSAALLFATAIGLLAFGCHGETLVVGGDAEAPDAGAGEVWTGYFENFQYFAPTNHLTLTFVYDATGGVTGTVFFGDPPARAPATDPDKGYPPIVDDGGVNTTSAGEALNRFPFSIRDGVRTGNRVTFSIIPDELWTGWCALQTTTYPYHNGYPDAPVIGYSCLPSVGGGAAVGGGCEYYGGPDGGGIPVDCEKLGCCFMLGKPCTCDETSCAVDLSSPTHDHDTFDIVLDGNTGTGTVSLNSIAGAQRLKLTKP